MELKKSIGKIISLHRFKSAILISGAGRTWLRGFFFGSTVPDPGNAGVGNILFNVPPPRRYFYGK